MNVKIERNEDGSYIAYNPDESGFVLIGTGDTVEECKADFLNTIEETVETYKKFGDDVPEALMKFDKEKFLADVIRITPEELKADEDRVAHREERRVLGMVAMQIRRALRKQGLSQSEFASMMGVDEDTVSLWLGGKYDFKLSTLSKVQKFLGIEIVNNWYHPN